MVRRSLLCKTCMGVDHAEMGLGGRDRGLCVYARLAVKGLGSDV